MKIYDIFQKDCVILYGMGLVFTFLAWIYFSIVGYPLINTAFETLNISTPPLYMLPIFFPYGILIGEILQTFFDKKNNIWELYLYFVECLIVGLISFIRLNSKFPISGHTVIIFFYITHQIMNNHNKYSLRILLGLIILAITVIYKIILWNDLVTFSLGALIELSIWVFGSLIRKLIIYRE